MRRSHHEQGQAQGGKTFIDYLRNQRGSTAILPYAARARENAPVAVPIGWDVLADVVSAHRRTIRDAAELLHRAASAELKGLGVRQSGPARTVSRGKLASLSGGH